MFYEIITITSGSEQTHFNLDDAAPGSFLGVNLRDQKMREI